MRTRQLSRDRVLGWDRKAAAGHASLLTTSVYLHVAVDEREGVGGVVCDKHPLADQANGLGGIVASPFGFVARYLS